jgi:hypothetical protein
MADGGSLMDQLLDRLSAACGVLCRPDGADGFEHRATAFAIADGEWLTVWAGEAPEPGLVLLHPRSGASAPIDGWEQDGGLAGFRCQLPEVTTLTIAPGDGDLHKRLPLTAVGYPSVIDHPAFALHHASLDVERYLPYCCPWRLDGHLCLFSVDEGWMAGRSFGGFTGAPVVRPDGAVVGAVIDGAGGADHPPLTRFRRLGRPSD